MKLKKKAFKERNMTIKSAAQMRIIKKALAVAATSNDSDVSSYLPAPLASEVIDFIRDTNIMRRLIRTFTMNSRTWKKPKRASGMSAYYIPDGVQATESGFTSTSVTWTAKKLMSYVVVDEEAVEDSQPDLISQILRDFADAVGEAEEQMILEGDTSHAATAPDPTSATTANWYVRDPRLAFDGIFTVAATADAADTVDGGGTNFDSDMVNKALYNLGKYGRNKSRILGIVPTEQASNIRGGSEFEDASKTGLALSSLITGLGSAGEGDSVVTVIMGVKFYEAPFAPAGEVAMFHKDSPQIGDRRMIKVKSDEVIEQDQRKYVISERIALEYDYRDALVLINNLSTTIVS